MKHDRAHQGQTCLRVRIGRRRSIHSLVSRGEGAAERLCSRVVVLLDLAHISEDLVDLDLWQSEHASKSKGSRPVSTY